MNGDVSVEHSKKSMVLGATVRPRQKDHAKPQQKPVENPHDSCDCCQMLLEHGTPLVSYVNVSKTDVLYDRTLLIYKLTGKPAPDEESLPKIARQLDRFEEAKFWDLLGLNQKMYAKLTAQLKKVSPLRLVFRKCAYRLHNTRHFAVPLDKKAGRKEDIMKANYEDDRKLIKRNQAFECVWGDCSHSFRDPQDMRIHYMFDHESVKLFCCGERYENYDTFLEHYVTSPASKKHATWSARECWGCLKRFVDADEFTVHADVCELQLNPFACPDPLCPMKYDIVADSIDHFFLWHKYPYRDDSISDNYQPKPLLVCNDVEYSSREDIQKDLPLIDDGQLILNYPLKALYRCNLCHVQFATEQYFNEHLSSHVEKPQFWLVPTILFCLKCNIKNCYYLRTQLLDVLPKLLRLSKTAEFSECRKHPLMLLWRLFLSDEFCMVMNRVYARLLEEDERLEREPREGNPENHKDEDINRISYIFDSLFYLYTQPYENGPNSRRSRF